MRQAFGAFKTGSGFPGFGLKPVLAALVLAAAPGCASLGLGGDAGAEVEVDALLVAEAEKASLEAELAGLKADNARLQTRVMELERKTAAAAKEKAQQVADAGPIGLKDTPAPDLTVRNAPSMAPAAPVVAAPETIVDLPDAPVPVDAAPRLVQPTFASTEQIFENEAEHSEIRLSSVLWGVHLASYRHAEEASMGWKKLQRENPDELGLLEPRIEKVTIAGKGDYLRLVGGGFSSQQKAKALCNNLSAKGLFCRVATFGGERLSMTEVGGAN